MEKFTLFYGGPFSQWIVSTFKENGITFNCAEQYMMYRKAMLFRDEKRAKLILESNDPHEMKIDLGRSIENFDQQIWDDNKEDIVKRGSRLKFSQNEDLKKALLETVGTTIVEASPTDKIWGIGLDGLDPDCHDRAKWKGLNLLGKVLTELRDEMMK